MWGYVLHGVVPYVSSSSCLWAWHIDTLSTDSKLAPLILIFPHFFPSLASQFLITVGHFRFLKDNMFFIGMHFHIVLSALLSLSIWHTPNGSLRSISQVTFFLELYTIPSLLIFLKIINSFISVFPKDYAHSSIIVLIVE